MPRFGATFGLAAALTHLTICLLKRLAKKLGHKLTILKSDRFICFIAAFVGAIPIALGLQKSELSLVKLIFLPLVWRCICDKSLESGFVPSIKPGGDILAYMLTTFYLTYCYMIESHSAPAMSKIVHHYS